MRVGHWDAHFGIAGDMALGALLDAGARLEAVSAALEAVAAAGVPGLRLELGRALRCGLDCARVRIRWDGDGGAEAGAAERGGEAGDGPGAAGHRHDHGVGDHDHGEPHGDDAGHRHDHGHAHVRPRGGAGHAGHHGHRSYDEIRALLDRAALAPAVRERAHAVFARLAAAEGRVHGRPPAEVHFHEVGGEDAVGDIVGTAAALEDLGLGSLTVAPLPAGGGTLRAAHGRLPVPAPAVALLLQGFDLRPGPVDAELVTPTGAAIIAALARPADSWPALRLGGSGWGAGARDFPGHPNACRLVWGEAPGGPLAESLVEIETNLDDQTPEAIGHLYERLFAAGALDVATSPLWMKKQRPGVRLWALARPAHVETLVRLVFAESTALGLRLRDVRRLSLPRAEERVETRYGPVRIKVGRLDGRVVNAAPEFEDCRAAAQAHGVPLKAVLAAALAAWEGRDGAT